MTLIDFIRHGETRSPGRLLGRTDAPLSEMGWQQFQRQTDGRRWALIVASPLVRARAPTERLAQTLGLNARIDADWSELDFGIWDGRPIEELQVDPEAAEQLDRLYLRADAGAAPQGESWRDLQVRVARRSRRYRHPRRSHARRAGAGLQYSD
jgi:alpha-ribazole phosphatase